MHKFGEEYEKTGRGLICIIYHIGGLAGSIQSHYSNFLLYFIL